MLRLLRTSFLVALIGLGSGGDRRGLAENEPPAAAGAKPSYALVVTGAKRVHDELTFEFKAPKLRAKEWVVYAARLPELSGQSAVRSSLLPGGRLSRDLSALGRPLLFARVPVQGAKWRDGLLIRVEYEATLLERRLERREPGAAEAAVVAPLAQKERRSALTAGHQFDFESQAFQGWLDAHKLRRETAEDEVDFARRVFLEIKKRFKPLEGDLKDRSASKVCQAGKSDSGGLAIVFVSALRANGIPSRVLCGRWAVPSEEGRNAADEPHIKAEFFATGVGWVPADPGSAVVLDKSEEGLDFFGTDDGDFLTLHIDTDIEFDSIYFGKKTMESLQRPSFWVSGAGTFDGLTTPVISQIRTEPIDPTRPLPKQGTRAASSAPAAEKSTNPQEGVTISGIVMERRDTWIMVKADGAGDPVKYDYGGSTDRRLRLDLQSIFTVGRVRLVYKDNGNSRQLISIKKQVPKAAGTVTGEVLHNHDWWVEVKPKTGPVEGYAVHFPFEKNKEIAERLKGLKTGDVVTITFTTDSERHRIETLEKRNRSDKDAQ